MSMFRRPGEDDSSTNSSSDGREEETLDQPSASEEAQDAASRIYTLGSTASGPGNHTASSSHTTLPRNQSNVRDLLLHSLLEEKALREAAQHLGRDKSDPEVKELARSTYLALSRQLRNITGENYDSDLMQSQRAAVQEGLSTATRNHLTSLTAGVAGGPSQELATRTSSEIGRAHV